ncbi:MAG TPA: antitoxin Xre/MbcA/ParS toxin-binding domain-containing protein [Opitutaceae bacterium]|jgi:uncharacterized protein (DUF2384 family)
MEHYITIPAAARQLLESALSVEIERLAEAIWELRRVDRQLFEAGMGAFGDEAAFALWLVRREPDLRDRTPLAVIAEPGGREEVFELLKALEGEGVF